MNNFLLRLAIASLIASLFFSNPGAAQILPPAKRAEHVKITKAPELEMSADHLTIIRWTSNNPGGSDVHYGVVHYGTDPKNLSETARSPLRLNQGHDYTIFRVRLEGLKPQTTYYYRVDSQDADGTSDKVKSPLSKFTTPRPGERFVMAFPKSN